MFYLDFTCQCWGGEILFVKDEFKDVTFNLTALMVSIPILCPLFFLEAAAQFPILFLDWNTFTKNLLIWFPDFFFYLHMHRMLGKVNFLSKFVKNHKWISRACSLKNCSNRQVKFRKFYCYIIFIYLKWKKIYNCHLFFLLYLKNR